MSNLEPESVDGLLPRVDFTDALFASIVPARGVGECLTSERMLELAYLGHQPKSYELTHLKGCARCAKWWAMHQAVAEKNIQRRLPTNLHNVIQVEGVSVAFPDGSIGRSTNQFGRLEDLQGKDTGRFQELVDLIGQSLVDYVRREVTNDPDETIVLAAFGNIVHYCARRTANMLASLGFRQVEVVGVHGFEEPRFECSIEAFRGATVICICDVAHHGKLLERMAEIATSLSAGGWVHKLAFVKQISKVEGELRCHYDGLWFEEAEERFTLVEFESRWPHEVLQLFEPETCRAHPCSRLHFDAEDLNEDCQKCIELDAVKVGHDVGRVQYPFFIDTLKLLRLDSPVALQSKLDFSPSNVLDHLPETLVRLASREVGSTSGRTALVYHVQNVERAGRIAGFIQRQLSQRQLKVTCLPVGWKTGAVDDLTTKQADALKEFDSILIVDSAMRTGDAMRSLYRMIREEVSVNTKIVGLTVIGPRRCNSVLATEDTRIEPNEMCEFKVWCAYALPLLPPIESLGDRIREWKTDLALWVKHSDWPNSLEVVSSMLQDYCGTIENIVRTQQKADQVLTRVLSKPWLKDAMEAVIQSRYSNGKDHKAPAAFVLMAIDEFEWIGRKSWISACSEWFTRATISSSAYWPVFLLAFMWLAKRMSESDCPCELRKNGETYLQNASLHLLDALECCRNKNKQAILTHLLSVCDFSLSRVRQKAGVDRKFEAVCG